MKGKNFETQAEIYQHLLSGGFVVRHENGVIVRLIEGLLYSKYPKAEWGRDGFWAFSYPEEWSIYEEPKKMKKIKLLRYTYKEDSGIFYQTGWRSSEYGGGRTILKTEEKEIEVEDV